jgi:cell division septal protein FtsQ
MFFAAALPGYQLLENFEMFRLRRITVQGNQLTSEEEIATLAGIRKGQTLFSFSTSLAEQHLCRHPWISQAVIRKSWPAAVEIQVEEHRPLALVNLESGLRQGLHYVDQRGMVFAPADPAKELDFPVITGFTPPEGAGKFSLADDKAAAEAMQFLHLAAQGHPMLPLQSVSEIHLSRDQGIVVYLAERPFPIYIGYGNISPGYSHLVKLLKRLYNKDGIENIREIQMDYQPGRILVARLEP